MTGPPENPYAPPSAGDPGGAPEAPLSFGWRVEHGKLLVQKEAVLPMVDLYSGESGETMILAKLRVRCRPLWLWVMPLIAVGALAWGGVDNLVFSFVVGLVLRLFMGQLFPICLMQAFFLQRTLRRRSIVAWLTFLLAVALGPILRAVWGLPGFEDILFLLWVVFAFGVMRQFTCRRLIDGWFVIRGLHPDALRELAAIQERTNRS